MKLAVFAVSVALLAGLSAPSVAWAFTQEPLSGGTGDGNQLADPSDAYRNRANADAADPSSGKGSKPSPFSLGATPGWEPRLAAPVERPGTDNEHLFWNNSSRYWR
jgi:hypothetical protein